MTNQKLSDEILRKKIQDIVATEKHLKEGNECYLIPAGWYDRLFKFVHENASRPPQINTRRLFQNRSTKLKKDLVDFSDYVIISKKLWNLLRSQFSSTQEIMRRVIKNYKTNQLFVELFPIEIDVVFGNTKKIIQVSKEEGYLSLRNRLSVLFNLIPNSFVLYLLHNNHQKKIPHFQNNIRECGLKKKSLITIELNSEYQEKSRKRKETNTNENKNYQKYVIESHVSLILDSDDEDSQQKGKKTTVKTPMTKISMKGTEKKEKQKSIIFSFQNQQKKIKINTAKQTNQKDNRNNNLIKFVKKAISPSKKETLPLKKETLSLKKEILPLKKEILPAKKEILPLQKETLPLQKEQLPLKKVIPPLKKKTSPSKKHWLIISGSDSDSDEVLPQPKNRSLGRYNRSYSSSRNTYSFDNKNGPKGICGLVNLGNTCYLNSALQCLSKTKPLTDYLLSNEFQQQIINVPNQKLLSRHYQDFLQKMWYGTSSLISPRNLKFGIEAAAQQFQGFYQHDSQELLSFLLDGLHKELNSSIAKSEIEKKTIINDENQWRHFSRISWDLHKKSNNSKIVDLFHGQIRSKLSCLRCENISIGFDPLMYFSLPIPDAKQHILEIQVEFVFLSKSQPIISFEIKALIKTTYLEVVEMISKKTNININNILFQSYNRDYFTNINLNETIKNSDEFKTFVAFEINSNKDYLNIKTTHAYLDFANDFNNIDNNNNNDDNDNLKKSNNNSNTVNKYDHDDYIRDNKSKDQIFDPIPISYLTPHIIPIKNKNWKIKDLENKLIKFFSQFYLDTENKNKYQNVNNQFHFRNNNNNNNNNNINDGISSESENHSDHKTNKKYQKQFKQEFNKTNLSKLKKNEKIIKSFNNWHFKSNVTTPPFHIAKKMIMELEDSDEEIEIPIDIYNSNENITLHKNLKIDLKWNPNLSYQLNEKRIIQKIDLTTKKNKSHNYNHNNNNNNESNNNNTSCKIEIDESGILNLNACLNAFIKEESLKNGDKWFCPRCNKKVNSTKKIDFCILPQICIIHLKRMNYASSKKRKINKFIDFPFELDFSPYLQNNGILNSQEENNNKYKLFAISEHEGNCMSGHYTSVCYNSLDSKWFRFNDSLIKQLNSSEQIKTNKAYILFYQKITSIK
ncbi:ubiquitin carboxyl-terminal hydrolase [Anaeramoeba flamelloides]|uniref:ubiquitinyl hydrolase 1 n=1 Tax=Anaeramoeba flamelloides TaxID=1746091 RepID=A0ABQ8Z3N8_9EUKA|nr:ubiquitin carboxyl-terminal hydrolase [Anaeramoeba flamelloides]